jgi:hypothetical protein
MLRFSAVLACVLGLATGCYTMNADLPGTLRTDVSNDETEKVGTFTIEKSNGWLLGGLVGAPPTDFWTADLQREVKAKGGDGAANIVYESQFSFVDELLGCVTCSIYAPRTYKLSGDIVKIREAALPGSRPKSQGSAAPSTDAAKSDDRGTVSY